jgi:hypothetical protein
MRTVLVGFVSALGLSAVAVLDGHAAPAGTVVRGVVLRGPAPGTRVEAPSRYRERMPSHDDPAVPTVDCRCDPSRYAVVQLTGPSVPPLRFPTQPPAMAQKDRMFVPSVLAIPVGGSVEFPNFDPFFHNVFSYSKTRSFDLGRYPEGESETIVFDKPGVVPIFCEIHYSMRAYIHVVETPYYAVTDAERRFEIPGVAPGEYILRVWQENLPEIRQPVSVRSQPVELEIP